MTQVDKARHFASLHVRGTPLVLINIWDAGSARAIAESGADAIATGSWSMAAAQGYVDGEIIPLDLVRLIVGRIVETVDLPLTVDMEGGYAIDPKHVATNVERVVAAGAVGINLEDGLIGEGRLHDVVTQCRRIAAVRNMAERHGLPIFINARTDVFLKAADPGQHSIVLSEAIGRARAYAEAGASGFFAPGLVGEELIAKLCDATPLPVNIMVIDGGPSENLLTELGVSRISYGPLPFIRCMQFLQAFKPSC